ncbi:unnamed protein product [Linum trigynum]|uniref:F-box domain-containing protein n=1 Tax=Linum trigynum TaxID=586398 RepID=A0AAV2F2K8_9ROSI
MDVPVPGNKSIRSSEGGDRISYLPQSLIEHILTFLPLREAAKTSILSTSWRDKWVNLPSLIFDDRFWTPFPVVETSAQYYATYGAVPNTIDKLVLNVFRVLCYHRGPLSGFSLSISQLRSYPAHVDQIMFSLYGKPIESLCIAIDGYKLPSRLFSFRQLKKLQLFGCMFTSSKISFEEFSMLTCLDLSSVKFPDVAEVSLTIRCPLLSALTMKDCGSAFNRLDILIEAPSLGLLHCVGSFSSLWVKEAPLLKDVTINQTASFAGHPKSNGPSNFMKLCGGCPAIERLSVAIQLFEDWGTLELIRQPDPAVNLMMLRQLKLNEVCLSFYHDMWRVVLLIQLFPNLQELIITTTTGASQKADINLPNQKLDRTRHYIASRLRKVELNRLQGVLSEMRFIQWVLSVTPKLVKMGITLSANIEPSHQIKTLKELNGFQRASSTAQIIFK